MSDEAPDRIPRGFRFAAMHAGIRKNPADDLALMISEEPASAAAVFTQNSVRAAPVTVTAKHLEKSAGAARAIVANAGNANCATPNMAAVAKATAKAASALTLIPREQVLLASTGVIGEPMDENVIPQALPKLWDALSPDNFEACAAAIMTTDTVPKTAYVELDTGKGKIRLAGMAKGAGMIMPNMATMLSFIFTDAAIKPDLLQRMLKNSVGQSFNCISVDSDTSTNDTVYLLANGASGIRVKKNQRQAFQDALDELTRSLAIAIARDGEGSRKLTTIDVEGASSDRDAKTLAMSIANSPLVKTAIAGADPNWGRILPAAGKSSVAFDPTTVDISVNGTRVCKKGFRAEFDEPTVQKSMEGDEVVIHFKIRGKGKGKAHVWTCDFTEDYIKINAEYRT